MIGLIGRKRGMTQVFQSDGTMVAVSVVEVAPNTVTRLRTNRTQLGNLDEVPGFHLFETWFGKQFDVFGAQFGISILWWVLFTAIATWILVRQQTYTDANKAQALTDFIYWGLTDGQGATSRLGYAPLPEPMRKKSIEQLRKVPVNGQRVFDGPVK